MEYSLLALVIVLVGALLWHTDRQAKATVRAGAQLLEHAKSSAAFLAEQQTAVLALVERIVNPNDRAPGREAITEEEIDAALDDVGWDPTDADPFLHDSDYAPFVPQQQFGDAPPIITHPMGIPGLEVPYLTNSESRVDL